jgi:hypothetical protein
VSRRSWRCIRWRITSDEATGRSGLGGLRDRDLLGHKANVIGNVVEKAIHEPKASTLGA